MMRATCRGLSALALLFALLWVSLAHAQDRLQVYTVNYPLAFFAERIAGDLADVTFPAPPDVDPAFWMPDAETIVAYQAADLILLNGAGYAKWIDRVSLRRSRLVDTSRAFRDAYIRTADAVSHSHGPTGEHDHGGIAFTTWLDLDQAARQAEAIARALVRKRPHGRERIERNLAALQSDLRALDARIAAATRRESNRPLLASHPVYDYAARRYGLNLQSVLWEPETPPSEAQWAEVEGLLARHPARWMLWEGPAAKQSVARLRSLGVESVVVATCANRPESGDLVTVMTANAEGLERVFGGTSPGP